MGTPVRHHGCQQYECAVNQLREYCEGTQGRISLIVKVSRIPVWLATVDSARTLLNSLELYVSGIVDAYETSLQVVSPTEDKSAELCIIAVVIPTQCSFLVAISC